MWTNESHVQLPVVERKTYGVQVVAALFDLNRVTGNTRRAEPHRDFLVYHCYCGRYQGRKVMDQLFDVPRRVAGRKRSRPTQGKFLADICKLRIDSRHSILEQFARQPVLPEVSLVQHQVDDLSRFANKLTGNANALAISACQLALPLRLDPVAQRRLDHTQRPGHRGNALTTLGQSHRFLLEFERVTRRRHFRSPCSN